MTLRAGSFRAALGDAPPPAARIGLASLVAGAYLVGVLAEQQVRRAEACLSALLVDATGLPAVCIGDSAVYRIDGRLTGHSITVGCTSILLLFPFVGVAVVLLLIRRVPVRRSMTALAIATVLLVATNQARMLVICSGMRWLGIERGYALTHILLGTVVSTVGMVLAAHLALKVVLPRNRATGQD